MDVEVRAAREDEYEAFGRTIAACFGSTLSPELLDRFRPLSEAARSLVALEGGRLVGTAEALRLRLTVPGGEVAVAGVTSVGVLPTHRRRGVLSRLMRRQLDDVHGWDEPVAVLWSSEGGIYHRYGYGLATRNARLDADRDHFAFRWPSEPAGRVRLLDRDEVLDVLPDVYERVRAGTPGFVSRTPVWWTNHTLADSPWDASPVPLLHALLELDGSPAGYVLYRVEGGSSGGVSERRLVVKEEIATSPLATRELWRYLAGVDLIARLQAPRVPADHPLFLLVAEPSRLRLSVGDGLYVRLVDAAAALAARRYAAAGSLVLDVVDALCPWNAGPVRLEAAPEGTVVTRGGEPELRLDVADLGSVYLGGFTFEDLRRASRVEELAPGALGRADALFRTPSAPWSPELF